MGEIRIRGFAAGDEAAFLALNEAWIVRYFRMEAKDRKMLGDPIGQIVSRGGAILMAESGGMAIGCCAMIPMGSGGYELAKMAVSESYQGRGVGRMLMEAVITAARAKDARRLFLETNSRMAPIHLYERMGFVHLPKGATPPSEYDRSDVCMELLLK